jgi:hypothetical protein
LIPSTPAPPILRLPAELRLKILKGIFHDAFYSTFGVAHLVIAGLPWQATHKPPVRALFLINKLLHDEAEEALWKNFEIVLDVYDHYKYPLRASTFLGLSPYAYSVMQNLNLVLYVSQDNRFDSIKTSYNVIIGNVLSAAQATWRFDSVARQLTHLQLITFTIFSGTNLIPGGTFQKRALKALAGIIGSFSATRMVILVGNAPAVEGLKRECLYRTRTRGQNIEFGLLGADLSILDRNTTQLKRPRRRPEKATESSQQQVQAHDGPSDDRSETRGWMNFLMGR